MNSYSRSAIMLKMIKTAKTDSSPPPSNSIGDTQQVNNVEEISQRQEPIIDYLNSSQSADINFDKPLLSDSESPSFIDDSDQDRNFVPPNEYSDSDSDSYNQAHDRAGRKHTVIPETTSEESDSETVIKLSRKRARNVEQWKRNIKKKKVNAGQSYWTNKNTFVSAKTVRGSCSEQKCRQKCSSKISPAEQIHLNERFWALGTRIARRNFVINHTEIIKPKYRHVTEGSNRGNNFSYYLTVAGDKIRVCKSFFIKTLDVGDKFIRNCFKKLTDTGSLNEDMQGKHTHHPKVSESLKDYVRDHIKSFPYCVDSHYLRAQTSKIYLDGSLTIAEMYRLYVKEQNDMRRDFVKKHVYETVFNTEFNLGFFQPKKDQCVLCDRYKNSMGEDKENLKQEFDYHIHNKELSRAEKKRDVELAKIESEKVIVSCFDLQSVLQTPSGDVSSLYYKRKLNCFNFTVYNIGSTQGYCFFWNEAIANRGVNEIATCVYTYLKYECLGRNTIFYSDNCVGQNKNKGIVALYLYAVNNLNIPSITHKYLIVGHTQNEGDTMHSVIEKQKKRMLKSGPIYVPTQWIPVLNMAKKTGKPYKVQELSTPDILDFKKLANEIGSNYNINTNNEKVIWNKIKMIKFIKETPYTIYYKENYDEEFKEIEVRRKQRSQPKSQNLVRAYTTPPKVSGAKLKDLLDLCHNNIIPSVHWDFYKNLKPGEETFDDDLVE